jgi:Domain of unknown function (DUF4129)
MNLNTLTVELRPRSGWEAIDLGSALIRRHATAIWKSWFAVTLPVLALLCTIAWALGVLFLVPVLMWWLRPVFDRIPLYVVSRAVFGAAPGVADTVRAQLRWGWRPMLGHLTWRRLSPMRAAMLPIDLLEGGDPAQRGERRRVLGAGLSGHTVQLSVACAHFIIALALALLTLTLLVVPSEYLPEFFGALWDTLKAAPDWLLLVVILAEYLATSLIEPFYVGGGFGLYLNRRTQLEAWDLEIAFRRMRQRIETGMTGSAFAAVLACALACLALGPAAGAAYAAGVAPAEATPAEAAKTPADATKGDADTATDDTPVRRAEREAQALLEGENLSEDATPVRKLEQIFGEDTVDPRDFGEAVERAYEDPLLRGERQETVWLPRDRERDLERSKQKTSDADFSGLRWLGAVVGFLGEYALWLLLAALVLFLLLTAKRWLPWLRGAWIEPEAEPPPVDTAAMLPPEPLPPDIATTARRLWQAGEPRRALALLYRASVEAMTVRANAALPPGATEAECLRAARRMPEAEDRNVFQRVVRVWQYAAYGQRLPDGDEFETLVDTLAARFRWSA